jgi:hypothetical protein
MTEEQWQTNGREGKRRETPVTGRMEEMEDPENIPEDKSCYEALKKQVVHTSGVRKGIPTLRAHFRSVLEKSLLLREY